MMHDDVVASFVDGMGAASASSGILSQQQGRIFALLFLTDGPLSLDEIAAALDQSKSNVSIHVRVLVDWHLVKRRSVPGSRRDHYEAATDFFRAFQEIFERRFRWTVRQVLDVVGETQRAVDETSSGQDARLGRERLAALGNFFGMIDAGIGAFVRGEPFPAQKLAA
ncbi:MAG: MarR family transcriptional regulator, partial [bacterium]|nr:MarR family transcriptional regulator [bacterium]